MLAVHGLCARYGRAAVLEALSFGIGPGETVALLGRNGAGKSTTLKALMGVLRPSAGSVVWEGRELAGSSPFRIARAGIGWVPEDRRLFADLTVAENLLVGRRRGSGWTEAQAFALFPVLGRLRDRLARQMSGGEQQMLALARTLVGGPRLLLLDEPSEGLAPVVVQDMARAIGALRDQGLSILLAEQNLRLATSLADRLLILERGRLVWWGTAADLEADEPARRNYLAV